MTAATLTHLPLAAGSALAASSARALLWAVSRYARAPLTNTCILALISGTALAGSNALFFQDGRHPAPLFAPAPDVPAPVTPAVRRNALSVPAVSTPKAAPKGPAQQLPTEPIGNAQVFEVQRKLTALGMFDGKIDGYYGPKTASAIRKFEERAGLAPTGELSPDVIARILAAPATAAEPARPTLAPAITTLTVPLQSPPPAAQQPAASIVPAATTPLSTGAVEAGFEPLVPPAPLALSLEASTQPASVLTDRPLPETPEEVLGIAVATAENAVGALVSAVEGNFQLGPTVQAMPAKPADSLSAQAVTPLVQPASASALPLLPAEPGLPPSIDPRLVSKVQHGLANLGFLHGPIDGVAGEATAKAIRHFETYYNYDVTGRITPDLVDLLQAAGAYT